MAREAPRIHHTSLQVLSTELNAVSQAIHANKRVICLKKQYASHNDKNTMNTMNYDFQIGDNVVRSKGDYVVGRTGDILELDLEKNRARVFWTNEGLRTWVSFNAIAPTTIPYRIEPSRQIKPGKWVYPKYVKL